MRNDLKAVLDDFTEGSTDISRLDYGIITLVPNIKNTNQIQKFRSVCLLHVSFKIVTKVLMNRHNLAAAEVISPIQTAFVIGRYIIEGVLTLYQALNSIHRKKQSALLLKVDFGKAYDKIVKCEF